MQRCSTFTVCTKIIYYIVIIIISRLSFFSYCYIATVLGFFICHVITTSATTNTSTTMSQSIPTTIVIIVTVLHQQKLCQLCL